MFDIFKIDRVKKDIEKYKSLLDLNIPLEKKKQIQDLIDEYVNQATLIGNAHQASTGVIDPKAARDNIIALTEARRSLDKLFKNARL